MYAPSTFTIRRSECVSIGLARGILIGEDRKLKPTFLGIPLTYHNNEQGILGSRILKKNSPAWHMAPSGMVSTPSTGEGTLGVK